MMMMMIIANILAEVFQNRCSQTFHRKTPVLQSKVADMCSELAEWSYAVHTVSRI